MWTHAPWQGRFLPHPLPPKERLHAYATWCNAVEGNTTFYATPARTTVELWAGQVEPDFRFVLKLPKVITHERRLHKADEELRSFVTAMEPLGPRAHAHHGERVARLVGERVAPPVAGARAADEDVVRRPAEVHDERVRHWCE